MNKLKLGKYKHYSGREYKVLGTVRHSETLEEMVLYKALYACEEFGKNQIWVRPLKMFFEDVEVEGQIVPRLKLV